MSRLEAYVAELLEGHANRTLVGIVDGARSREQAAFSRARREVSAMVMLHQQRS